MTPLERQRDDGPLARAVPAGHLPGAELLYVVAGVVVGLSPALLWRTGAATALPWAGSLAGIVLALAGRSARPLRRLDWSSPALLRLLEYGTVVLLVGATPITYALLATLAFRHYDIVYRERTRGDASPSWLATATGGWECRTTLLAVGSAFGAAAPVALAVTLLLVPLLTADTIISWRRSAPAGR